MQLVLQKPLVASRNFRSIVKDVLQHALQHESCCLLIARSFHVIDPILGHTVEGMVKASLYRCRRGTGEQTIGS